MKFNSKDCRNLEIWEYVADKGIRREMHMKVKELKDVIVLFEKSDLTYLKFAKRGTEIIFDRTKGRNVDKLEISTNIMEEKTYDFDDSEKKAEEQSIQIKSAFVGMACVSEEIKGKELPVFVQGGTSLGVVEAMKIYNDVIAPGDGYVEDILFSDGDMVEFDQILFSFRSA